MPSSPESKKIALNINFDSLYFPLDIDRRSVRDPSYFVVADRFFSAIDAIGAKCSIYIIGRDLENGEVAARVRSWAEAGHEIGNHTWSHHHNLAGLPKERMRDEIVRAHDMITRVVGKEPRGFIAPAWSTSTDVVRILNELGYLYDTSIFPSPVIAAAMTKLMLNGRRQRTYNAAWWDRKDKRAAFVAPRQPYYIGTHSLVRQEASGLVELPLPTFSPARFPCWQTMAFYLGPAGTRQLIRATAAQSEAFYYLMHPADLTDYLRDVPTDIRSRYDAELSLFERLRTPFAKKEKLFQAALAALQSVGTFVTVEELARDVIAEQAQP